MKKKYQVPSIEIIELDNKDIIVMSETGTDAEYCEIFGTCDDMDATN